MLESAESLAHHKVAGDGRLDGSEKSEDCVISSQALYEGKVQRLSRKGVPNSLLGKRAALVLSEHIVWSDGKAVSGGVSHGTGVAIRCEHIDIEQTNIAKGTGTDGVTTTPWVNGLSDWIFFFGSDTVAEAVAVPEEMRGKIPTDFGRSKGIAWYYLGGFGIVHTTVINTRIVKWDSAAAIGGLMLMASYLANAFLHFSSVFT